MGKNRPHHQEKRYFSDNNPHQRKKVPKQIPAPEERKALESGQETPAELIEGKEGNAMQNIARLVGRHRLLALIAGGHLLLNPGNQKAYAQSLNSLSGYQNPEVGRKKHPDKLTAPEVKLMDDSWNAIQRQLLQESFVKLVIPYGKGAQVQEDLMKLMRHYDHLHFEKEGNDIIITRRNSKKLIKERQQRANRKEKPVIPENFKVVIRAHDGTIKEVNGVQMNMSALGDWKTETNELFRRLNTLNNKINHYIALGRNDIKIFQYCHLDLPRQMHRLLKLKADVFGRSNLSADERSLLQILANVSAQPRTIQDYIANPGAMQFYLKPGPDFQLLISPPGIPIERSMPQRMHVTGKVMKGNQDASTDLTRLHQLKNP